MTNEVFGGSGEDLLIRRAKLLQPLLVVWLATTFAISVLEISELAGLVIEEIESMALTLAILFVAVGTVVMNIIVIVIFAMWIYRAAANVRDAEVSGFEYTPGWSVGWYFVPFANWFKPFTAMRQIWNASRGAKGNLDDGNSTLTIWWIFWLTSNIANHISMRLSFSADNSEMLAAAAYFGLAGSVASVPLFFAARQLITDITDGQTRLLHHGSASSIQANTTVLT